MRNMECLFRNTATWFNSSISSFYMVGMIRVHRVEFEQPPTHLTGARRVGSNKMRTDDTHVCFQCFPPLLFPNIP